MSWNSELALETSPWHCADLETRQELSAKRSCAQGVDKCPSQPKLQRQTALQPHSPFWPYSVLLIMMLIPNTISGGFPARCWALFSLVSSSWKEEKAAAGLKGKCPTKSKCFTFMAAVIPSQLSHCPWVKGSWMLLATLGCWRCHSGRAQSTRKGEKKGH